MKGPGDMSPSRKPEAKPKAAQPTSLVGRFYDDPGTRLAMHPKKPPATCGFPGCGARLLHSSEHECCGEGCGAFVCAAHGVFGTLEIAGHGGPPGRVLLNYGHCRGCLDRQGACRGCGQPLERGIAGSLLCLAGCSKDGPWPEYGPLLPDTVSRV